MRGKNQSNYLHLVPVLVLSVVLMGLIVYARAHSIAIFDPAGPVAEKERNLIYLALGLSLIVVLPVFGMLFGFAWKYREGNPYAKYSPELEGSRQAEALWWGIPGALIITLSIVTWNSSHNLDPSRKLVSTIHPLQVQVVALDWKWLFIYPQYNVASINELHVPTGTPVNFELTSDAPMNSFWIPRLGGQVYAMPGMMTHLSLQASKNGSYRGQSANISGTGFAGMHFQTLATSQQGFEDWFTKAKQSPYNLDMPTYTKIAKPTENNPIFTYASVDPNLFGSVMSKYMSPGGSSSTSMGSMEMTP